MSGAERERLLAQDQAADTENLRRRGIPLPSITRVRLTDYDTFAPTLTACLQTKGWDVQAVGLTGMKVHVLPSQEGAFELDRYVCTWESPLDPLYNQPLSKDQLKIKYDYNVNVLIPCLRAQGLPDSSDVPTVERYLADPSQWDPFANVTMAALQRGLDEDKLAKLCPREPSAAQLFGR